MKKITLSFFILLSFKVLSQTWSTGPVEVTTGYIIQFDVNTNTDQVTLTMMGPDDQWLGVGPGIMQGLGMGNSGDDAIIYSSLGLQDRHMPSGTGTPNLDGSQDWSVQSNTDSMGTRILIATRARDTGDSNDFVFPISGGAVPILWAKGSSLSFGYHGGTNRGGVVASLTLGVNDFITLSKFKISPNPVSSEFEIKLPDGINQVNMDIFDVFGKLLYSSQVSKLKSSIDISSWDSGIYLVRINSDRGTQTKRIIKQ